MEREKQVLRKSEWWENEKLRRSNEEGVAELVFTNGSGTLSDQDGNGAGEEGSGGMGSLVRVGKRSLMTESIPWLGLIRPARAYFSHSFINSIAADMLGNGTRR